MQLSDFQKSIAQAVMRSLGPRETMRRENQDIADTLVKPNDRLDAFERLQIYNQQFWWRTLGALAEDFKGLAAVLGSKRFEKLSIHYLDAIGSQSWNLGALGQHLPEFIQQHPALTGPYTALALDMARTEWAKTIAFDAADHPLLNPEQLMGASPDQIHLSLQPYITLLELCHPTDRMLLRLKDANSAPQGQGSSLQGKVRRGPLRLHAKTRAEPIHLAVHRQNFLVYYKRLSPEAFVLLQSLKDGANLEDACARAIIGSSLGAEDFSRNISIWFQEWMHFGWLCERES
jgi:hypothetical protein